MKGTIFTILGVLAMAINPVWVLADTFDLSWYTFDGSYTLSTGGGFSLGGTVGQPEAAAALAGGGFSMTGGFWPGATSGPAILRGDLSCDGVVDFGDINPFVLYLSNFASWQMTYPGCTPENGDINGDGTYGQSSFGDINPFVALLSGGPQVHRGDLNCDGTYGQGSFGDINPFVLYLSNFSAWQADYPGCDPRNGDINGDGTYGQGSFGDINPFVALLSGGG